ncbi:MAG: transcription antitermination factor NusB [Ignavibacteriaceae bacterium]|nr:transcription antitermination factor NusB [Ignavibacteriaceae bacterium]
MITIGKHKSNRRIIREKALQVLYAYYFNSEGIEHLFNSVFEDVKKGPDRDFGRSLVNKVIINWKKYDLELESNVQNWIIERIAILDLIIIKIGLAEINEFPEIPPKVTINECIELAKEFSTDESGKFVNGILDRFHGDLKSTDQLNKSGLGMIDKPAKGKHG